MTGLKPRRVGATGLTLVWLLGLHVLPLAHNVGHRNDHSHGRPEARPGSAHSHSHPHPHSHSDSGEPAGSDHGDGSLLHYAVAVLERESPDLAEPGAKVASHSPPDVIQPESVVGVAHLARGPPIS